MCNPPPQQNSQINNKQTRILKTLRIIIINNTNNNKKHDQEFPFNSQQNLANHSKLTVSDLYLTILKNTPNLLHTNTMHRPAPTIYPIHDTYEVILGSFGVLNLVCTEWLFRLLTHHYMKT